MARTDTVGTNFYKPVVDLDRSGTILFWLIATLSIILLIIDKVAYPESHQATQIVLLVLAVVFFIQGQVQRLYLFPRAEDARRQQLLSNSYNVALSHEATQGYYNNDQTNPLKRLAASTFESALFTKNILRKMLHRVRIVTLIYFCFYTALVSYRGTSLEWVAVMAQVLFGEEILVRWLRMEWLRKRTEEIYDGLNRLFFSKQLFSKPTTQSQAIDLVTTYESSKSTAAVVLSSKIFEQMNPALSLEWDDIRRRLVI